jgi:hypothetical protein
VGKSRLSSETPVVRIRHFQGNASWMLKPNLLFPAFAPAFGLQRWLELSGPTCSRLSSIHSHRSAIATDAYPILHADSRREIPYPEAQRPTDHVSSNHSNDNPKPFTGIPSRFTRASRYKVTTSKTPRGPVLKAARARLPVPYNTMLPLHSSLIAPPARSLSSYLVTTA